MALQQYDLGIEITVYNEKKERVLRRKLESPYDPEELKSLVDRGAVYINYAPWIQSVDNQTFNPNTKEIVYYSKRTGQIESIKDDETLTLAILDALRYKQSILPLQIRGRGFHRWRGVLVQWRILGRWFYR